MCIDRSVASHRGYYSTGSIPEFTGNESTNRGRRFTLFKRFNESNTSQIVALGVIGSLPYIGFVINCIWANILELDVAKLSYDSPKKWRMREWIKERAPLIQIISCFWIPRVYQRFNFWSGVSLFMILHTYHKILRIERLMNNLEISWLHRESLEGVRSSKIKSDRCVVIAGRLSQLCEACIPLVAPLLYFVDQADAREWLKEKSEREGTLHQEPIRGSLKKKVIKKHIYNTTNAAIGAIFQVILAEMLLYSGYSFYYKNHHNLVDGAPLVVFILSMTTYALYLFRTNMQNKHTLINCFENKEGER